MKMVFFSLSMHHQKHKSKVKRTWRITRDGK